MSKDLAYLGLLIASLPIIVSAMGLLYGLVTVFQKLFANAPGIFAWTAAVVSWFVIFPRFSLPYRISQWLTRQFVAKDAAI
jgi:hypothetical protein